MTYKALSKNASVKSYFLAVTALTIVALSSTTCAARVKSADIRLGLAAPVSFSSMPAWASSAPRETSLDPTPSSAKSRESNEIVVTGRKVDSEIVVTARQRKHPVAVNKPITVVAVLLPPKQEAKRDFDPVVRLARVRRDAKRISAVAFVLSGVDGIVSATCVANGTCVELNPFFGKAPSMARMLGTKGVVGGAILTQDAKSADIDPYAARSDSYVKLATNLIVTISSMGTGL